MIYFVKISKIIIFLYVCDVVCCEEIFNNKTFQCLNGDLINLSQFCDGIVHCLDNSDEITNISTSQANIYARCNNGLSSNFCAAPIEQYCSGTNLNCPDLNPCENCRNPNSCHPACPEYYRCPKMGNLSPCILRKQICESCNPCVQGFGVGFKCPRNEKTCILPQFLLWDGVRDCEDGSDLCYETTANISSYIARDIRGAPNVIFNTTLCWKCLYSDVIINRKDVCDGTFDCPDLSDECLCERGPRYPNICRNIQIDTWIANCSKGDVKCSDGKCIKKSQLCDGIVDCEDQYDESNEFCFGTISCTDSKWPGQKCSCHSSVFGTCANSAVYCNSVVECLLADDDILPPADECTQQCLGYKKMNNITSPENECIQDFFPVVIKNTVCKQAGPLFDPTICCKIFQQFVGGDICCNGIPNEANLFDDENNSYCDTMNRFKCDALGGYKKSISATQVCDTVINCDDRHDEMNCTQDNRFYCEVEPPLFVLENEKYDGIENCNDGTDECPTKPDPAHQRIFSSREDLIEDIFLRYAVWIMGIIATIGNIAVICHQIKILWIGQIKTRAPLLANHMLVLNLACGDLIMGIYLLSLGILSVMYHGSYCRISMKWRSSSFCTALGMMAVLSTETSVATLVMLTLLRLVVVLKPLKTVHLPKAMHVITAIIMIWIYSIFLAVFPVLGVVQNIFTPRVGLFDKNPLFNGLIVNFRDVQRYLHHVLSYYADLNEESKNATLARIQSATTWTDLQSLFNDSFEPSNSSLEIKSYFGYYSTHSVCLPKIFVTTRETSWLFSSVVVILNFSAFLIVMFSYIIILRKSHRGKKLRADNVAALKVWEKQHKVMQRKIARLIVTDFCCWVPICIMSFLRLANVPISNQVYAVSAIILFPINSALNPLLYSSILDILMEWVAKRTTQVKVWWFNR